MPSNIGVQIARYQTNIGSAIWRKVQKLRCFQKIKDIFDYFVDYFLDYDKSCILPRKYFWDIFSILNQGLADN